MLKQMRKWSVLLFCTLLTTVGVAQTVTVESIEQAAGEAIQLVEAAAEEVSEEIKAYAEDVAPKAEVAEVVTPTLQEPSLLSVVEMCWTEIANACSQAFDAIYRIVTDYLETEPLQAESEQTLTTSGEVSASVLSE